MNKEETIGIIGGVGPSATSILYERFVSTYKERMEGQYPQVFIYSLPINKGIENNMIRGLMDAHYVAEVCVQLLKGQAYMQQLQADVLILPCNTLTYYAKDIFDCPFENPIDATIKEIVKGGYKRVGLLATTGTCRLGMFENLLSANGIACVYPNESDQVKIAYYILQQLSRNSRDAKKAEEEVLQIMQDLAMQTDVLALGCTDLFPLEPLAKKLNLPVIDSLQALINSSLQKTTALRQYANKN